MLIKRVKLVDERIVDIRIDKEVISDISSAPLEERKNEEVVEGRGRYILPGMIDLHTHMRDPGLSHKEDLESGSMAAVKGGVTTIIDMPNTIPTTTTLDGLEEKRKAARRVSIVNYGFNFGGSSSGNESEIERARNIVATKIFLNESTGKMLIEEDSTLDEIFKVSKLVMVHGEGKMVEKAIDLGIKWNKPVYLCHISTKEEMDIIREKKKIYNKIYVEVTPHHLTLTKEDESYRNIMKPTLKRSEDREALWKGIEDGIVDTIGTDHAPHLLEEKREKTLYGVPGIETALPLLLNYVSEGRLTLEDVVRLYSYNPSIIGKISKRGKIEEGYYGDLVIVNLDDEYIIKDEDIVSKCRWTPFNNMKVKGRVEETIVNGRRVYNGKEIEKILGREVIVDENK